MDAICKQSGAAAGVYGILKRVETTRAHGDVCTCSSGKEMEVTNGMEMEKMARASWQRNRDGEAPDRSRRGRGPKQ